MSTVAPPISENPRIRALVSLLVERQRVAREFLDAREHTASPSKRIAYALDARLILHPEPAPAEVVVTQRRAALLHAIKAQGGRWKTGHAIRLYRALGYGPVGKSRAAQDLRHWQQAGLLQRHDRKGVTYYTPITGEDSSW
jgi:hypothetical protein